VTPSDAIASIFDRRGVTAMFVGELQHAAGSGIDAATFFAALQHLTETGVLIIVTKPAPDPHLTDLDLRIVARATPDASGAVEAVWHAFLRDFLASHRCS
jgi:hypothetical protein